ncbi:hypothetical protein D3C71_2109270 [compost metagenome]
MVAKGQFQPKGHPAWPAANATRQINKQRVLSINLDATFGKLTSQAATGHGIAQKQRL